MKGGVIVVDNKCDDDDDTDKDTLLLLVLLLLRLLLLCEEDTSTRRGLHAGRTLFVMMLGSSIVYIVVTLIDNICKSGVSRTQKYLLEKSHHEQNCWPILRVGTLGK